jgi:hypothetical protein
LLIIGKEHSQFGSFWLTDENTPYLMTNEPIQLGSIQIVEADGLQLLEMQKQAFSTIYDKSNVQAQKIKSIILKEHNAFELPKQFPQIDFYDKRLSDNESQALAVKKSLAVSED